MQSFFLVNKKNEIISQPFSYKTKSEFISSKTHLRSNQHTTGFFAATAFRDIFVVFHAFSFIARGGEMTGNEAREREKEMTCNKGPQLDANRELLPSLLLLCYVMLCSLSMKT